MTKNELIAENRRLRAELRDLQNYATRVALGDCLNNEVQKKDTSLNRRASDKAIFVKQWWAVHRADYKTNVMAASIVAELLYVEFELPRVPSQRTIENYLKSD